LEEKIEITVNLKHHIENWAFQTSHFPAGLSPEIFIVRAAAVISGAQPGPAGIDRQSNAVPSPGLNPQGLLTYYR